MKKLIEFQEDKHGEVLNVIAQFRADSNTTFSEAVRRLILSTQNGACAPAEPNMAERMETVEKTVDVLKRVVKKYVDENKDEE